MSGGTTTTILRNLDPDTAYKVAVVPVYPDVEGIRQEEKGKTSEWITQGFHKGEQHFLDSWRHVCVAPKSQMTKSCFRQTDRQTGPKRNSGIFLNHRVCKRWHYLKVLVLAF